MPRYGDFDALMEVIRENDYPLANRTNSIDRGMFTVGIQQAVDEQPTADVAPVVHAEWVVETEIKIPLSKAYVRKEKKFVCTHCGKKHRSRMNFCGNCGAKMDGGQNE